MRTTLNIDDRMLGRLKREAERSGVSLTEIVNRTLELGVERLHPEPQETGYRCSTFSMGVPASGTLELDKALSLAADLEDEEILRCGATLCSTDNDFARFAGLRFENPLKPDA